MIDSRRRVLPALTLLWLSPTLALALCWWFKAPSWVTVCLSIASVSATISFLASVGQYQEWKRRLQAIESSTQTAAP